MGWLCGRVCMVHTRRHRSSYCPCTLPTPSGGGPVWRQTCGGCVVALPLLPLVLACCTVMVR